MKQSAIDRAVARATGESMSVIRRMGFSVVSIPTNSRPYPTGRSRKHNRRDKLVAVATEA